MHFLVSERASISSVQWKSAIYIYLCIFFSMVRSRAYLRIALTARQTADFTWAGVALTNAADSSITHTQWKKRKQIREGGNGREARQNESEIQKKEQG